MEQRMEYALEYADMPADFWENVVFSDEKTFYSDGTSAAQYVWRKCGTRLVSLSLSLSLSLSWTLKLVGCFTGACSHPNRFVLSVLSTTTQYRLQKVLCEYFINSCNVSDTTLEM